MYIYTYDIYIWADVLKDAANGAVFTAPQLPQGLGGHPTNSNRIAKGIQ